MQHFKGLSAVFPQYSDSIYNHIDPREAAFPHVYIKVSRKIRRGPGKPGTGSVQRWNSCSTHHLMPGIGE
jgi:hypothetical protein